MQYKEQFVITVERIDGKRINFRLTNDLQNAMHQLKKDQPKTWRSFLKGSLITVPMISDYRYGIPPLTVGKILGVFLNNKRKYPTSRSQFGYNWQNKSTKELYTYLRHDYSFFNRLQIKSDIEYWKSNKSTISHKLITHITKYRTSKIYKKQMKYHHHKLMIDASSCQFMRQSNHLVK